MNSIKKQDEIFIKGLDKYSNLDILLVMCPPWDLRMPPMNLAYLSSYLRKKGIKTLVLDANIWIYHQIKNGKKHFWKYENAQLWDSFKSFQRTKKDIEKYIDILAKKVASINTKFIGFTVHHSNRFFVAELAKQIKIIDGKKKFIIGGPSCLTKEALNEIPPFYDYNVVGDGEEKLLYLLRSIQKGIISKEDIEKVLTDTTFRPNLADLYYPTYEEFNLCDYLMSDLPLSSSRGCIGNCAFCFDKAYMGPVRFFPIKNVIDEITYHVRNNGINHFSFLDSLINANSKRLDNLCDLIIKNNLKIQWSASAIPLSNLSFDLLKKMKKSGCVELIFGVESGSDTVLKSMGKLFTSKEAERVIQLTKKAGIKAVANIIVGFPTEKEIDFKHTLDFINKNKAYIDRIGSLNLCAIYRGTTLHDKYQEFGIVPDLTDKEYFTADRWVTKEGNTLNVRILRLKRLMNLLSDKNILFDDSNLELYDKLAMQPKSRNLICSPKKTTPLIVGNLCNNNCLICDLLGKKGRKNKTLIEIKKEISIIDGGTGINILGGEPLLRKDFDNILGRIYTQGFNNVSLRTNARLFYYSNLVDKWSKKFNCFVVPIFGHIPFLHDTITRVEGSFEQTIKGIENLIRYNNVVEVEIILTKLNYSCLKECISLLYNLKVKKVRFVYLGNKKEGHQYILLIDNVLENYVKEAISFAENKGMLVLGIKQIFDSKNKKEENTKMPPAEYQKRSLNLLHYPFIGNVPKIKHLMGRGELYKYLNDRKTEIMFSDDFDLVVSYIKGVIATWKGFRSYIELIYYSCDGNRNIEEINYLLNWNEKGNMLLVSCIISILDSLGAVDFEKQDAQEEDLVKKSGLIKSRLDLISKNHDFKQNAAKFNKILLSNTVSFYREHADIMGLLNGSKAYGGPLRIEIHPTNRCNNNCVFCWVYSPLIKKNTRKGGFVKHELNYWDIKTLIDKFADMGTKIVLISGGGEPLLYPNIVDLISYIKSKGLSCTLNTNFTMMNKEIIRKLVDIGLDNLIASIHAGDAKTYALLHQNKVEKDFYIIKENLLYFHRYKNKKHTDKPQISTYNVMCSINSGNFESVLEFGIGAKVDKIQFTLVDSNHKDTILLLLSEAQRNKLLKKASSAREQYSYLLDIPHFNLFLSRLASPNAVKGKYDSGFALKRPCYSPWIFAEVFADGNVTVCTKQDRTPIGNIGNSSVNQIWNCEEVEKFRVKCLHRDQNKDYFTKVIYCDQVCDNVGDMRYLTEKILALSEKQTVCLAYLSYILEQKSITLNLQDLDNPSLFENLALFIEWGLEKISLINVGRRELVRYLPPLKKLVDFSKSKKMGLAFSDHGELLMLFSDFYYLCFDEVYFYITNQCNSKCVFCWDHSPSIHDKKHFEIKQIPKSLFKKILDDFVKHGVKRITLIGDGEPTLHPDFKAMVEYAYNTGVEIALFSNGLNLDQLKDDINKINHYFINISAASSKTYSTIHKLSSKDSFSSLLHNIQSLTSINDLSVDLINVINSFNIHEVFDMVRLGANLNANRVIIKLLSTHNVSGKQLPLEKYMPNKKQLLYLKNQKGELEKLANTLGIGLDFQYFNDSGLSEKIDFSKISCKKTLCLSRNIKVDSDGNFYPCAFIPLMFGNLRAKSLTDFKNKFRKFYRDINDKTKMGSAVFGPCRKVCILDKEQVSRFNLIK
ncbi:MAG: radical SAM protein [Nanoarchaeota archaeon]